MGEPANTSFPTPNLQWRMGVWRVAAWESPQIPLFQRFSWFSWVDKAMVVLSKHFASFDMHQTKNVSQCHLNNFDLSNGENHLG